MKIPLSQIRPDPANVRRVQPADRAAQALQISMNEIGLLQPIGVRITDDASLDDKPIYQIVFGHQRFAAAERLGWEDIDCTIVSATTDNDAIAQTAENMVRLPMHPVDTWRAIHTMMERGSSIENAALALGLDETMVRRLERLGDIAPEILEAIAMIPETDFPDQHELRLIANAPREKQIETWERVRGDDPGPAISRLASALRVVRIPKDRAKFPADRMSWDLDLFASPDDPNRETTSDIETFMALQREAALEMVAKEARRYEVEFIEGGDPGYKGMVYTSGRPKKGGDVVERVFIHQSGWHIGDIDRRQFLKEPQARKEASSAAAGLTVDDDETPPQPTRTMTDTGLRMVAAAREVAISQALDRMLEKPISEPGAWIDLQTNLLAALLITMAGGNVEIRGERATAEPVPFAGYGRNRVYRVVASMVEAIEHTTDGDTYRAAIAKAAAEAIRLTLVSKYPKSTGSSGACCDEVGRLLDALLPRFDTAEFLGQLRGETLRAAWSITQSGPPPASVAALRAGLVGKAECWAPAEARFSARIEPPEPDPTVSWDDDEVGEAADATD